MYRRAQETFRSQLLNVVSNVLNLYWDLVTDNDDLAVRQRAVDQAQKFYDDTRKQIELGVIPRFEASRAQSGLTNSRQLLAIAQATAQQQENLLKNAISRNGLEDPLLDAAQVVTLDRIEVPEQDNLPALRELVAKAHRESPGRRAGQNQRRDGRRSPRWVPPTAYCRACKASRRSARAASPARRRRRHVRRH